MPSIYLTRTPSPSRHASVHALPKKAKQGKHTHSLSLTHQPSHSPPDTKKTTLRKRGNTNKPTPLTSHKISFSSGESSSQKYPLTPHSHIPAPHQRVAANARPITHTPPSATPLAPHNWPPALNGAATQLIPRAPIRRGRRVQARDAAFVFRTLLGGKRHRFA